MIDDNVFGVKKLTLKEIPVDERPREKLLSRGPQALSDAELLAIILVGGTRKESAVQLAQRMLAGGLVDLERLTAPQMKKQFHGVGTARAAQVKAALELARRYSGELPLDRIRFSNSKTVFEYCHREFRGKKKEEFWVLSLDAKNKLNKKELVSNGTLMSSLVHPREVFETAIRNSAAGIIVLHNHPSGDPEPSPEDRRVTAQLAEAGKLLGIPLLDHVIIGNTSYYSFKDSGTL